MRTKEEVARRLADYRYSVEPTLKELYRIRHKLPGKEDSSMEPIKLLEVNSEAIAAGILPLGFDPDPHDGIDYPYIIVEITPDELGQIRNRQMNLPENWTIAEPICRTESVAEVA